MSLADDLRKQYKLPSWNRDPQILLQAAKNIEQLQLELKSSWQAGYKSGFINGYNQPEVLINPEFEAEQQSKIVKVE